MTQACLLSWETMKYLLADAVLAVVIGCVVQELNEWAGVAQTRPSFGAIAAVIVAFLILFFLDKHDRAKRREAGQAE